MRLTLRTLLAYLDDTLPANEIKEIGLKVNESDSAQQLIGRIKEVTRRRRLTVPPATGPNGFDPNDVADYLDNELDADKLAELEKQCLESDVHLAEIAACHQILALVLGEPALVPPTAKQRMYGLVRGREAIPSRRAAPVPKAPGDALDEDETLGLGGRWLPWLLPVAGLLLVVTLGVGIYQLLDRPKDDRRADATGKQASGAATEGEPKGDAPKGDGKPTNGGGEPKKDTKPTPPVGPGKGGADDRTAKGGPPGKDKDKDKEPDPPDVARVPPPSKDRKPIGTYAGAESGLPSLLVSQYGDRPVTRVPTPAKGRPTTVYSGEALVTLPGFVSELRVGKNQAVKLIQRGSLREFALAAATVGLLESAVVLHASDAVDLDLTLLRGRIFLRNNKPSGPCKVRLRFDEEAWDLDLAEPGDEAGVDLTQGYTPVLDPAKEPPERHVYLGLLRGKLTLTTNAFLPRVMELGPGRKFGFVHHSNITAAQPQPAYEAEVPLAWSLAVPALEKFPREAQASLKPWAQRAEGIEQSLKRLAILAGDAKLPPVTELRENRSATAEDRLVAIYAMGAMDDLSKLIDALGDDSVARAADREAAYYTLRSWASRGPGMARALYDEKDGKETGLLLERNFKPGEAKAVRDLIYPFRREKLGEAETYELLVARLQSPKVAVAEMAFQHLAGLCPPQLLPPGFNAAAGGDDRRLYADKVQALIDKKQLPPMPPAEKKDGEVRKDKG